MKSQKISHKKRKLFFGISGSILIFLFILTIVAFAFENKIADLFLQKIYQYTTTEISHKDVSLSLIRKFPSASLEIKDIEVKGNFENDTLLHAENIFLSFNLLDIIKNNFVIKKIEINKAIFHMKIDVNGKNNWNIFISEDTVSDENFKLALNSIQLNKINYQFKNDKNKFEIASKINSLNAKGDFENKVFAAKINTKLNVANIIIDNDTIIENQNVRFNTKLHIDTKSGVYKIEENEFNFDFMQCNILAQLSECEDYFLLSAQFATQKADVEQIAKILPDSIKIKMSDYKPKGYLACDLLFDGVIGENNNMSISGNYTFDNMSISNIQTNISLNKIYLDGDFSTNIPEYQTSTKINIKHLTANLNRGNINGAFYLENLISPLIDLDIQASLKLEDWQNFMPKNYIHQAKGDAEIAIIFKHKFENVKNITALELNRSRIKGFAYFSGVSLQLKENDFAFENLSGKLDFNNQTIQANNLSGIIKENAFDLNGRIENIFPYLLSDNQDLKIIANLNIKHFNLDKFLKETENNSKSKKNTTSKLVFPQQIYFDLSFQSEKITYQKFEIKSTSGRAILSNNTLHINNCKADAFKGNMQVDGKITQKNNNVFLISCQANLQHIDIERLFYSFSNFGQNQLTNKNIKGIADCKINFSTQMQSNLSLLEETINSSALISIDNGELYKFKPLESLSKFVSLNELNNIKFNHLATQIKIENRTISIPEIYIQNSALNVKLYGNHTFDHDIDYHIVVSLQELLSKKFANKHKQREDFGDIVEKDANTTYLYLWASGNLDNPKFRWDKKSANKGLQQKIASQKAEIIQENQKKQVNQNKPSNKELNNNQINQKELELDEDW